MPDRDDPPETPGLLDEKEFARLLIRESGLSLTLRFTRNRASLLSVRRKGKDAAVVSIQHAFRAADAPLRTELARFVKRPDRRSRSAIASFLRDNRELVARFSRPRKGRGVADPMLGEILEDIATEYGLACRDLSIGWSRADTMARKRRSIRLGSFRHADRSIRIHPILKSEKVPDYFLRYIVFHEALHAAIGPMVINGKTSVHHALFRRRERDFRHYDEARHFEKRFVASVLAGQWKG